MATTGRRPIAHPLTGWSAAERVSVAFRCLWWALGEFGDGTILFVPAGGGRMVAVHENVLHASDVNLNLRPTRRRTVDTVCGAGARKAKPLIVHTDAAQALVPIWPPPAQLHGMVRCEDCVAATGKKRPHKMYVGLSFTTDDPIGVSA